MASNWVLFRAAAGPRMGFGHLVRTRVLARALRVPHPQLALRGGDDARRAARDLGFALVDGDRADVLSRVRARVLVIDDPASAPARQWRNEAGRLGLRVASVHDVGRAFCRADLTVDGSLTATAWREAGRQLIGPQYAILDPGLTNDLGRPRTCRTVLIALGGGPRVSVARALARRIRQVRPDACVRIAAGFSATPASEPGILWMPPLPGLGRELASCAVAVVAGGVSLYESAVLRTPVVTWPVVRAQHPTVSAFARTGHGRPVLPGPQRLQRAAEAVADLLDANVQETRGVPGLDGQGAVRVAAAIRELAREGAA